MAALHRSRRSAGGCSFEVVRSNPITCNGSIFTAQLAFPVKSVNAANAAIALMRQESHATVADHNMSAYRVSIYTGGRGKGKIEKSYDDDGEAHGGQRIAGCLTKKGACDVAVMVSRVYGGVNIGKRRFEIIVESTSALLDAVGHVQGRGIQHAWGGGNVLGGAAASSSSSASAAAAAPAAGGSSAAKKRKRDPAAEAEEQARAAERWPWRPSGGSRSGNSCCKYYESISLALSRPRLMTTTRASR